jgi:hypothetical protein
MGLCIFLTIPFYFPPSFLWAEGLITAGYASSCAVVAWGFFLKAFTPKNERNEYAQYPAWVRQFYQLRLSGSIC